jgi:hypothetical protein
VAEPCSLDLRSRECGRRVEVWFVDGNLGCRFSERLGRRLELNLIDHVDKVGKSLEHQKRDLAASLRCRSQRQRHTYHFLERRPRVVEQRSLIIQPVTGFISW